MQFFTHLGVNFVAAEAVDAVERGARREARSNDVSANLLNDLIFIESI